MTSTSPLNRLLGRIKNLISSEPRKAKKEIGEKDELLVQPAKKEEKDSSKCPHRFRYLASRPKGAPIPQECLTCQEMLECRSKLNLT